MCGGNANLRLLKKIQQPSASAYSCDSTSYSKVPSMAFACSVASARASEKLISFEGVMESQECMSGVGRM